MGSLVEDPPFLATTFVVIEFETTTPTGYTVQPVEVAALASAGWVISAPGCNPPAALGRLYGVCRNRNGW
jgi:hypothetical protein